MSSDNDTLRLALYERVCESYHAVDDFRMKLLGLLPVATGTGVFLLLSGKTELLGKEDGQVPAGASDALLAIGGFGFLFTLGLFAYELFGIKKCHYLILAGTRLEGKMGVPGQFRSRPRDLAGFINEPFASAIIYPASMAAWAFLALSLRSTRAAAVLAGVVLVVGYKATRVAARRIKENQEREDLVLEIIPERGSITVERVLAEAVAHRHAPTEPIGLKRRLHRLATSARRRAQTEPSMRQPHWVKVALEGLQERGDIEEDKAVLRRTQDRSAATP